MNLSDANADSDYANLSSPEVDNNLNTNFCDQSRANLSNPNKDCDLNTKFTWKEKNGR